MLLGLWLIGQCYLSVLNVGVKKEDLLPKVVEDHDVCVHVEEVVAVGWVVIGTPLFWLWAPKRELVAAVFGLVVYAVKARHLDS